jgi:hypothetical protein
LEKVADRLRPARDHTVELPVEPGYDLQETGFADAREADDGADLSVGQLEGQIFEQYASRSPSL